MLVEPYLFKELNLLSGLSSIRARILHAHIISRHARHIQVIRANIGDEGQYINGRDFVSVMEEGMEANPLVVADIISRCKNLRSLGVYYTAWHTDFEPLAKVVVELCGKKLQYFGVYSRMVLDDHWSLGMTGNGMQGPMKLLSAISSTGLKALDVATEWMPREMYDVLQSSAFGQLERLNIRYSLRYRLLWSEDSSARNKWSPRTDLVSLQLIRCQAVYAPDIPIIVRIFTNLEELLVSMCGHQSDVVPPTRKRGWSGEDGALCRVRRPLRIFIIEHMEAWEMLALGVIPVHVVICANVVRTNEMDIVEALKLDEELFPSMKVLRLLPEKGEEEPSRQKELASFCSKRRVELRWDAERYKPCLCCRY